jgi:hypothetical protein
MMHFQYIRTRYLVTIGHTVYDLGILQNRNEKVPGITKYDLIIFFPTRLSYAYNAKNANPDYESFLNTDYISPH